MFPLGGEVHLEQAAEIDGIEQRIHITIHFVS